MYLIDFNLMDDNKNECNLCEIGWKRVSKFCSAISTVFFLVDVRH